MLDAEDGRHPALAWADLWGERRGGAESGQRSELPVAVLPRRTGRHGVSRAPSMAVRQQPCAMLRERIVRTILRPRI